MTKRSDNEAEILNQAARHRADPMSPSTPSTYYSDNCGSPLNRRGKTKYADAEPLNIHGQPGNLGRRDSRK
jgi:hypothetical protein